MNNNVFSENLLKLRKDNKLSLQALGDILGISNQAVSLLEKGKNVPSFDTLVALANYFDVPVDYLVGNVGANLTKAILSRADMREAKACGAIFCEADLSGADLRNSDLRWSNFSYANLQGAKLEGAKLEGAIFVGANVSKTILEGNIVDGKYVPELSP